MMAAKSVDDLVSELKANKRRLAEISEELRKTRAAIAMKLKQESGLERRNVELDREIIQALVDGDE